jgi:hypothetical protein
MGFTERGTRGVPLTQHGIAVTKQGGSLEIRNANIEIEFNGYPDIRLSGSGDQNIRVSGLIILSSLRFPDILTPGIPHPDFLVP